MNQNTKNNFNKNKKIFKWPKNENIFHQIYIQKT
jgi:hypothetical protein